MSRLASFLTALWFSSAADARVRPGIFDETINDVTNMVVNEAQAATNPIGQTIAFIGGSVCQSVKKVIGVAYEDYEGEPDMTKLNLVLMTSAKTVMYNLSGAAEEIPKDRFDPTFPLRIFLHGFTDNPMKDSFQTMRAAYAELERSKGKLYILALDSSSLIQWFYLRSTTMVKFIGEKLGATMAAMIPAGLDPKNIHLIGHSLGSHIAGFAGQQFISLTGSKVGRISSLDPAGPCFAQLEDSMRLSHNDADFVDVIHTNAGVYGLDQSIGHVDFWPNGGNDQPGCLLRTCSHSRAWEYYAESVTNPAAFIAVHCDTYYNFRHGLCDYNDTTIMGFHTPTTARGNYYCIMHEKEPFGASIEGLTYQDNGIISTISFGVMDFFAGRYINVSRI